MNKSDRRKRAFDIAVSSALLPVALPLMIVALIAIRLDSPGSPLFAQRRVGRAGNSFMLFKLRTMSSDTGDIASHEVNAAKITRLGRLLRRSKLDELPQLLNVLNGSMSLVGPRPCLPSQVELIEARAQRGLLAYRPGITGPAQVAGIDMSDPIKLAETELAYYPDSTFAADLVVLLRTFTGAGSGDAATVASQAPKR